MPKDKEVIRDLAELIIEFFAVDKNKKEFENNGISINFITTKLGEIVDNKIEIFGSSSLKQLKYPSDIDFHCQIQKPKPSPKSIV